ncbi:hypothetical protein FO519_005573 [Halicephalobus sp. NKZ332]|nr:hypothetical protein FO519_005573 [Halicephalobus sp. NKZ332]
MTSTCLASNFPVNISKDSIAYHYEVKIVYNQNGKEHPITRTDKPDAYTKRINREIINEIPELKKIPFAYDAERNLWTSKKLWRNKYFFSKEKLPSSISETLLGRGMLNILITSYRTSSIKISDFYFNQKNKEYLLKNLIESVIFEHSMKNNSCQLQRMRFFGSEGDFGRGLIFRNGYKFEIQMIRDPSYEDKIKFVLSLDVVKKVFYPKTNFLEAFNNFVEESRSLEEASKMFKRIKIRLLSNGEVFIFRKFGGSKDEPIAIVEENNENFSLEFLEIIPDQAVPFSNSSEQINKKQISLNVVDPEERYKDIMKIVKELQFPNPITESFGITVDEEMMEVRCDILQKPRLMTSGGVLIDSETREFNKESKFFLPAKVENCGIIYEQKNEDIVKKFAQKIQEDMNKMGMIFSIELMKPVDSTNMDINEWKKVFGEIKLDYFLVVDECEGTHENLKLAECLIPGLATQHITLNTVKKIEQGDESVYMSLCLSINARNGGLNYRVMMDDLGPWDINSGEILVIGLDIYSTGNDHKECSCPSVVGFSANYVKNPNIFFGNFFFQDSMKKEIDQKELEEYIKQTFEHFQKEEDGKLIRNHPTHIVILRNEIRENQHKMVLEKEFTVMRKFILENYYKTRKPAEFILFTLTKRNNTRHFLKINSRIENLPPGSCIDENTKNNSTRFYIIPQKNICGSSHSTLVTVLVNEPNASKEVMKQFIHYLCYYHQTHGYSVSTPGPIAQANKFVERGLNVFEAAKKNDVMDVIRPNYLTWKLSYERASSKDHETVMANTCVASNFPINIPEDSIAYHYDVKIIYHQNGNENPISRTDKADAFTKNINRKIMEEVPELKEVLFVYDAMQILWTSEKLKENINCRISKDKLPTSISKTLPETGTLEISIIQNREQPFLNLGDFSSYREENNWIKENHSLRNVLELVTSEHAIRNGFCQMKDGRLFGPEEPFERGLVIRLGCQKGAQFIQDPSSKDGVKPILVIDSSKKVFYPQKNFLEAFEDFNERARSLQETARVFRGVKLRSLVSDGRVFTFERFGDSVNNIRDFDIRGYHKNQYGIELKHLNEPTAIMKNMKGNFPLEVLEIVPDQPVPLPNLPPLLEKKQKRSSIVKPNERYRDIINIVEKLKFHNSITEGFGINVHKEMMKVRCEILEKPKIKASKVISPRNFGEFNYDKGVKFLVPAEIKNWRIIYEQKNENTVNGTLQKIKENMKNMGMKVPEPSLKSVDSTDMKIDKWMKIIAELKLNYILVVDEREDTHGNLKLVETLNPELIVQHLKVETAEKIIKGGRDTCMNLCMKINVKKNGLNHKVVPNDPKSPWNIDNGKVLVLGLDVNHPTGNDYIGEQTQPSSVGFCANYSKNPNNFLGDFFYQKPRQEKINAEKLQKYVDMTYGKLRENGRDCPQYVFILRDGVSEGQYSMVIEEEFAAIRETASKFGKTPPKLVLMVMTKRHNIRHFLKDKSGNVQSLSPGSFVGDGAREGVMQFFIAAHKAIQGTSQDILVTVLVNDPGISKAAAIQFIHELCYLHQVFRGPISLPEPVYQADELAERGMTVYKAAKENQIVGGDNKGDDNDGYDHLTAALSYGKACLPNVRYNA